MCLTRMINATTRLRVVAFLLWYFSLVGIVGCGLSESTGPSSTKVKSTDNQLSVDSASKSRHSRSDDATSSMVEGKLDRVLALKQSDDFVKNGEFSKATSLLRRVLVEQPEDAEAIFRYANIEAAQGDLKAAIELLDSIPTDHPQAALPAIGQSADWYFQIEQYDEAERRYRKLIELAPQFGVARRKLAQLLNRQGRRHEAAEQVRELCRIGDVSQEELHSLLSLSDAIYDDPSNGNRSSHSPQASMLPIGASGRARIAFTERRYVECAKLLQEFVNHENVPPSVNAFYGRALAEGQNELQFLSWLQHADESTKQYAEFWAGLGTYLVDHQQFAEAVRVLGEAIRLDPTDLRSLRRINQSFVALGEREVAERWFDHYVTMRDVTLASNRIGTQEQPDLTAFPEVIDGLIRLERPLEATLWQLVEAFYLESPESELTEISERRKSLARSEIAFASLSKNLCGLRLEDYPMPKWESLSLLATKSPLGEFIAPDNMVTCRFENIAKSLGIEHRFEVASKPINGMFSIYQTVGGGVCVLDFDLDGAVDLYLAQGSGDPPKYIGTQSNHLYRNLEKRVSDVTLLSGTNEYRYSIGVTAGDWNQDGFPDLMIANLGQNRLMINNGDGTFRNDPTDGADVATVMTTSVAIADVTNDAIPDMIELNYLDDPNMPRKPSLDANGIIEMVAPLDFKPGMTRILVNDGYGGRKVTSMSRAESAKATGLGIVVSDFDGSLGNEIFVGNDIRPDNLWKWQPGTDPQSDWVDMAPISGCSLGNGGSTTASMGIAAADFDQSGSLDLYITNFENESASFFLNQGNSFQDRSIQYNLSLNSLAMLGFGCQSIDYNNDGREDIVVTNGHVENTGAANQPFKQLPQFFVNLGATFELIDVEDQTGYFGNGHVGRALATLDFNRDGKTDFIITHIDGPTALILNKTETSNHWVKVRLAGTTSERDAIGAKVTVRCGEKMWSHWSIAGDGYLCHNEDYLSFGLGNSTTIDEITIQWPSGKEQTMKNISPDQCYLMVEGDSELFSLGYSNFDVQ